MFGPAKTDNTIILSFGRPFEEVLAEDTVNYQRISNKKDFFVCPSKFLSNPNKEEEIKLRNYLDYEASLEEIREGRTVIGINKVRYNKSYKSKDISSVKIHRLPDRNFEGAVYDKNSTDSKYYSMGAYSGGRSSKDGKEIITGDTVEGDDTPQLPDDKDKKEESYTAQLAKKYGITEDQLLGNTEVTRTVKKSISLMSKRNDAFMRDQIRAITLVDSAENKYERYYNDFHL